MRLLSMFLVGLCIIMQQQKVAAKPFIFKLFVPQAPARADSSSSTSSSSSSGFDFSSIIATKLNLLTSLLRTSVSGGFNFGFKKLLPTTQVSSTRRPYTSTTIKTPVDEFEPDSTSESNLKTTTSKTSTTTTSNKNDKTTDAEDLGESIDTNDKGDVPTPKVPIEKNTTVSRESKVTTEKTVAEHNNNVNVGSTSVELGYDYTTSDETTVRNQAKATTMKQTNTSNVNNGYDSATSTATTFKPNGYGYYTPQNGDGYSNQAMSENEISNEVMAISNQYLPAF